MVQNFLYDLENQTKHSVVDLAEVVFEFNNSWNLDQRDFV